MRSFAALLLTLFSLGSAGLAQKVTIDTNRSFNFRANRHYMWRDHPLAATDPVMQQATVAPEVVRSTVNERLMKTGFKPVDHDPDFYVTYFVTGHVTEELRILSTIGTTYWYGWAPTYLDGWVKYGVDTKLQGALVLDFIDARTHQLAWRAYCRDTITDMTKRDENIARAVNKAMKQFPPKPAK